MSSVNEAVGRRMTLGYLVGHYGFDLEPRFATDVTVTSLADDVTDIQPGSLYIPNHAVSQERLAQVRVRGAYAALLPHSMRQVVQDIEFPLLFAEPSAQQIGKLSSDIAGAPANTLAVFGICGSSAQEVQASVVRLADFLHMLGNPVGVISAAGSMSLERDLEFGFPVGIFDVQHTLAVCVEDGAAAMVFSLDDRSLHRDALQSVNIDVLGTTDDVAPSAYHDYFAKTGERYGFSLDKQSGLTTCTEESDLLAHQTSFVTGKDMERHLSLAISMVLAAGVRRGNIKNALRVSRELG